MTRPAADSVVNGSRSTLRRSDRFLGGLADFKLMTLVSHVQADPDSLGSMLGLAHLVETCLGKPARLTRDGPICRSENRAMIELLGIELESVAKVDWQQRQAVVMVDSQPNTGRHSFNDAVPIYAVIDHHQTPGHIDGIPFVDIRRNLGATCSLVTRYLMEQELPIPEGVATALLYGIETELSGFPREASPLDDSALHILYPLADKDLLAKIRNTPLPQDYFECILQALQSSFIYDRLILSWVNELAAPELAAQVVDFLVRLEGIDWAICAGVCQGQMILSLRTGLARAQAGEMLRQVVTRLGGQAGGHDRRAGGFLPLPSTSATAIEQVQGEFRRGLLKALQIEECRGHRLVPRREMLQYLQV